MSNVSRGLRLDIVEGTGFVLEAGVYSIYACLFIAALPVLITKARREKDTDSRRSGWVFLVVTMLMYLVATLHLVFAAVRFYKGIFSNIDPKGPISYLQNVDHWDYSGVIGLLCIQTWLGDILVIYRCYIIWSHNLWLISIPVCLLFGQIGVNTIILYWFRHPSSLSLLQVQRICDTVYPLAFAQNLMTTSLIILKILLQHRESRKAGIVDMGSKLGLIRVVRMLIESAAIYTIQMFILVILCIRRDNFQYVLQAAVTPSIGITFVLLAIRIEASRNGHTQQTSRRVSTFLPQWAHHNNSEISSENHGNCTSGPSGDRSEVADHTGTIDSKKQVAADNSWDLECSSNSIEPSKATSIPL